MKLLNGSELAGYIMQRQVKQVRGLRQAQGIAPKLAILQCEDDPAINTYVRLKKQYGADIGVEVDSFVIPQDQIAKKLQSLETDSSVHGVIVQLPLTDTSQTEEIVKLIAPDKDVDALGPKSEFDAATATAILWLLSGYNVELKGKNILLIGRGRLVGAPLEKMLQESGLEPEVIDRPVDDLTAHTVEADIIITATGSPRLLNPDMVKPGAVIVDAGVASEAGKMVGDVDESMYERDDLTITSQKGGVGPLTISALFDNLIRAARQQVEGS